jgi:hypothetical protein
MCPGFSSFVHVCIVVGAPIIKKASVGITLSDLIPLHPSACPQPGSGFLTSYVMVVFYMQ